MILVTTFLLSGCGPSACGKLTVINERACEREISSAGEIKYDIAPNVYEKDCYYGGMKYKVFSSTTGLFVINVTKDSLECDKLK